MFELSQFTLDGIVRQIGDPIELRREMRRGLEQADALQLPYHAIICNPQGQVVASL
jgi:hypothetical protein